MSEQLVGVVAESLLECAGEGNEVGREDSVERLREDAERYRWLRQQQAINCWPQVVDGLYRLIGNELDAAVDEAMHAARGARRSPRGRSILN